MRVLSIYILLGIMSSFAYSTPNVVLISIDTLRWDHCTVYGYKPNTTPTLKRVAKAGVCFESAYAPASSTCPSHATMLTSLYPITHGVVQNNGTRLDSKVTTLAEYLSANGYDTAGIVSIFPLHSKFGFNQGFSFFDDNFVWEHEIPRSRKGTRRVYHGVKVPEAFTQKASETTRKAIQWVKSCKRPFFLFLHYVDPHGTFKPPEPFASRFPADLLGRYDAQIAYVDNCINKFLGVLGDDALVVITSDHGESLSQRGWEGHAKQLYDEGVRVPLIFYWPGHIKAGLRFSEPVDLLSIAPTILDLADIKPCDSFVGKSLKSSLCDGRSPDPNHPVYLMSVTFGKRIGIRLGNWKYIELPEGKRELFNLADDPKELHNLCTTFPKRADMLAARLTEWERLYKEPDAPPPVLSEEDIRKLKSLGYLK